MVGYYSHYLKARVAVRKSRRTSSTFGNGGDAMENEPYDITQGVTSR